MAQVYPLRTATPVGGMSEMMSSWIFNMLPGDNAMLSPHLTSAPQVVYSCPWLRGSVPPSSHHCLHPSGTVLSIGLDIGLTPQS